ncbi:MAG: MBOAT family O-acyltransferase [Bdellovibrionota bacterium]
MLIAAASSDFILGNLIAKRDDEKVRFRLVALSVTINLGILGFFKYFHFFTDTANLLMGSLGLHGFENTLDVILPLGISFYTFETISYVVDVYKRRIPAYRNVLDYYLFVGFFPHLVAGPILRFTDLIPQFYEKRTLSFRKFADAVLMIAFGLMAKFILADTLGSVVDFVYTREKVNAVLGWTSVFGFGYQIYVDFWSYTLIARGAAKLFCIELPENFRQPYLSADPTEFWRRWHISLSSWFRDYLYIPLGGKNQATRNILITMAIAGLWHGSSALFILWGIYQGLLIVVFKKLKLPKSISFPLTFILIQLGWILFRSSSLKEAGKMYRALSDFTPLDPTMIAPVILAAIAIGVTIVIDLSFKYGEEIPSRIPFRADYLKLSLASAFVMVVAYLGESGASPFIYFHF